MKSILLTTALIFGGTAYANPLAPESSPRPKPRPAHLQMVTPHPCALILTDKATGFQWYDDGTVAGRGQLPKADYRSAFQAWAFIDTTARWSPSAEGVTFTPACFKK